MFEYIYRYIVLDGNPLIDCSVLCYSILNNVEYLNLSTYNS
jgi:hypothetical protein